MPGKALLAGLALALGSLAAAFFLPVWELQFSIQAPSQTDAVADIFPGDFQIQSTLSLVELWEPAPWIIAGGSFLTVLSLWTKWQLLLWLRPLGASLIVVGTCGALLFPPRLAPELGKNVDWTSQGLPEAWVLIASGLLSASLIILSWQSQARQWRATARTGVDETIRATRSGEF